MHSLLNQIGWDDGKGKEHPPYRSITLTGLIAQVLKEDATEKFMATRRREQQRALQKLREDPGLGYVTQLRGI